MVVDVDNMPSYMQISLENPGGIIATNTFDNKRYSDYLYNFSHIYETGGAFKFELVKENNQITTWINDVLATSASGTIYYPSGVDRINILNPSTDVNLNVSFYGEVPSLEFLNAYSSDSISYTGQIINHSLNNTRLLGIAGVSIGSSYPSVISGLKTGSYCFSGDFINSFSDLELDFDFDFGRVTKSINIVDSVYTNASGTGFLNFSIDTNNIIHNSSGNFNASYYSVLNSPLLVKLEHTERFGNLYYSGSGSGISSGLYSGYLDGEGYLESYGLTGYVSGYLGLGYGKIYSYATGQVITDYTVEVSGYESGNLSTGYLQGFLTGNVGPSNTGRYHFNGSVIGTPSISVWHGGINVSPVGLYTGNYNFYKNAVGNFLVYSGGDMPLGASQAPAQMTGIENHFTFKTGEPGGIMWDYTSNGWYSGSVFQNTNVTYPSGILHDIEGNIGYISGSYGVTDVAQLTVSGNNELYSVEIYGTLTDHNETSRVFVGYVVRDVGGEPAYKYRYYYPLTDTFIEE